MTSKVTILGLALALFTLPLNAAPATDFQGSYSQKTEVIGGDDGNSFEEVENTVDISKVEYTAHTYFVEISGIGGHAHLCQFAKEMSLMNGNLIFNSKENGCHLKISKTKTGVQVVPRSCESYCGMGLSLEGTGDGFKYVNPGHSILKSQESPI